MSQQQLEQHIRNAAKTSSKVYLTSHAKQRMKERGVSRSEVGECLMRGAIKRPPEPNTSKGSLEATMEFFTCGKTIKVVVALTDEDPSVLVVTVML